MNWDITCLKNICNIPYDEMVFLKGNDKDVRQFTIAENDKIKPAIITANDTDLPV